MMAAEHALETTRDPGEWACLLRERFVALDVSRSSGDGFVGDMDSWSLGHLQLSQVSSGPQLIERSTSLVRSDHRAYLQVGLMRSGHARVAQDGREAVLGPGDFVVYETTRPFTWALHSGPDDPRWQLDVLTWPRQSIHLAEADSQLMTAVAMSGRSGFSGILSRMMRDLMTERPQLEGTHPAALADEIGNLLTVLTNAVSPPQERTRGVELTGRIEAYIDSHLDDPDLGPESLARAHAISVRQLHRLFADRQLTVARTIRSRRLEMCRRDLVLPANAGCSVTQIARRWGYVDLGAFGRAFRAAYGASPRVYRGLGGRAAPT